MLKLPLFLCKCAFLSSLNLLIFSIKKERRLCGEKDDGDGGARQKEKRKAKEKVDGFGERRHGKGWS